MTIESNVPLHGTLRASRVPCIGSSRTTSRTQSFLLCYSMAMESPLLLSAVPEKRILGQLPKLVDRCVYKYTFWNAIEG